MTTEYIHSDTTLFVAGVDEVARGTFIGPVVAACVVLPRVITDDKFKQIKDSKKLSEKKRTELALFIKENAITYGIGTASVEEIDSINILHATMKAMHRAIDEAYKKHSFDKLLIDGQYFKGYTPLEWMNYSITNVSRKATCIIYRLLLPRLLRKITIRRL
uniref:Ribonuclease HII n=1 Tax=viral metagenome TaxID=1070528 RepID=A0A6C0LK77_9ZZZZ